MVIAVASPEAVQSGLRLVARGGVVNLFGGLKQDEALVPFDTSVIHYREINVTGSSGGSPWDVGRALALISAGDIDPGAHITRIGDLEHAVELLGLIKSRAIDGKAVVYPHRHAGEVLAIPFWAGADEERYLATTLRG